MLQLSEEELLMYIKSSESELNTLAEIHKLLVEKNIRCSIEELRQKVGLLHRDGYLGNEPTGDGMNMYYIIYYPGHEKDSNEI
ncbi:hypothetical protein K9O30_08065 [Clostridium bowmanii]|uniref:hypothetical protein n=1 Tax=Clostridium bowmanii TaxID=132925 RepID=UPI001C0E33EF|nr:hypothetical protein [Clostridium bowmanii]MBU3188914.1 hypothetical protein [Clostridium bowmanii]MCA1073679.1 hypothetical protein [Clostridium bowmanii]